MQNTLNALTEIETGLEEEGIQALPPKSYFKYRDKYGDKVYIPILNVRGHSSRLSRKLFKRAHEAQAHSVAFRKRFNRLKGTQDGIQS